MLRLVWALLRRIRIGAAVDEASRGVFNQEFHFWPSWLG